MSKIEISKELTGARDRLVEIQLSRVDAERSADDIQARITALAARPATGSESRFAQAARQLLSGAPKEPGVDTETLRAELGKTRDRLGVLREAERLQKRIVDDIISSESIVVCDSMRDEHAKAVRDIAQALRTLLAANQAERAVRDRVIDAGLHCHLTPMTVVAVGQPDDVWARGNMWFIEATQREYLDAKTLPKNVRAMIPPAAPKKVEKQRVAESADGWLNAS